MDSVYIVTVSMALQLKGTSKKNHKQPLLLAILLVRFMFRYS
jgi:hypothetical protein